MSKTELAWAAGFIDGDGWIGVRSGGKTYKGIALHCTQKDRRVLDKLVRVLGVGHVYGPYTKHQWHKYQANGKDGLYAINLVKPYLSEAKLQQVQESLAAVDAGDTGAK